jgi:hypothetical protein
MRHDAWNPEQQRKEAEVHLLGNGSVNILGAPLLSSSPSSQGVQQTVTADTWSGTLGDGDFFTVHARLWKDSHFPDRRITMSNLPVTVEEKTLVDQEGNWRSLRQSPIMSCYKWL